MNTKHYQQPGPTSWQEIDRLLHFLHRWDITYLVGFDSGSHPSQLPAEMDTRQCLAQLVRSDDYPRIRDASISLFLLHPELITLALDLLKEEATTVREPLSTLLLATLYLYHLWSVRLTLALGKKIELPESSLAFLWQERNLPSPDDNYGKTGLLALQKAEQERTGLPLTYIGDWQNQVEHLLQQEEAKHHPLSLSMSELKQFFIEEENVMSMRPGVNKEAIETFLRRLGKDFRKPGRLYLVGGAALVHLGLRPGFTQDIDIQVAGANEGEMIVVIQQLIQRLHINIKFASPGDFIPLPSHWESHSRYVGRYGNIDVFYFDFYSIALSKIERGNNRDIADVRLLLQNNIITLDELDKAYKEVLTQLGKGRYPRLLPQKFTQKYTAIRSRLEAQ